ncbi:MAG: hypothetical protein ACOCXN_02010 [Spirochaetota bacterium]
MSCSSTSSCGNPSSQIEPELGIGNGFVYRWRRRLQGEALRAFPGNGNEGDKVVAELRRENVELREERGILREWQNQRR